MNYGNINKSKFQTSGKQITLEFSMPFGSHVGVSNGLNNTSKEAVKMLCLKTCLSEKDLVFLYKSKKLNVDNGMTLGQIGIEDFSLIKVILIIYVTGAKYYILFLKLTKNFDE